MNILLTGSTGFIGKNILKKIEKDTDVNCIYLPSRNSGFSIESIKFKNSKKIEVYCNLNNEMHCADLFKNIKIDKILHFAAEQGRTPEAYKNNVGMTSNLLKYCPEKIKFVYASSSTIYGDSAYELNQSSSEDEIKNPTSLYGASKLAGEHMIGVYQKSGKIDSLILRYVAIVGKGATHGVLPDILKKIKSNNNFLELFGNCPGSKKPYLHIKDATNITLKLLNSQGVYNVSPSDFLSIEELANIVMKELNITKDIKWLGNKVNFPGDNPLVWINNKKILKSGIELKYETSKKAIIKTIKEIEE